MFKRFVIRALITIALFVLLSIFSDTEIAALFGIAAIVSAIWTIKGLFD